MILTQSVYLEIRQSFSKEIAAYSQSCQISKMENSAKIVNSFQASRKRFSQNTPSEMFDRVLNRPLQTSASDNGKSRKTIGIRKFEYLHEYVESKNDCIYVRSIRKDPVQIRMQLNITTTSKNRLHRSRYPVIFQYYFFSSIPSRQLL